MFPQRPSSPREARVWRPASFVSAGYRMFVTVNCESQMSRCQVVKGTSNPEWNADFIFYRRKPLKHPIDIEVRRLPSSQPTLHPTPQPSVLLSPPGGRRVCWFRSIFGLQTSDH